MLRFEFYCERAFAIETMHGTYTAGGFDYNGKMPSARTVLNT